MRGQSLQSVVDELWWQLIGCWKDVGFEKGFHQFQRVR